jgi:hypothetical protein
MRPRKPWTATFYLFGFRCKEKIDILTPARGFNWLTESNDVIKVDFKLASFNKKKHTAIYKVDRIFNSGSVF